MNKYKKVYLFLLVIFAFVLNNYNNYLHNKKTNSDDSLGYFVTSPIYNLDKDYVYVKNDSDELIKSRINLSGGTVVIEEDKLKFLQWDYILREFFLVRLDLGNLNIDDENIIVREGITYDEFTSNITTNATYKIFSDTVEVTSGDIKEGMQLKIYYNDEELDSYDIINIKIDLGNLNVYNRDIVIDNSISYEKFISNITSEATYKIFNETLEVTSGEIKVGMLLKFYYNEQEFDSFNIVNEYINLDKLIIKNDKYIIENVSIVDNLKRRIDTNGDVIVIDSDGNILKNTDYLATNSKVRIELSNSTYEYTIVVLGDVTGSGDIFIGDISKLYQYYKKTIDMEESYVIAGDVTFDGMIEINDIAKLYQFYKGTIDSL